MKIASFHLMKSASLLLMGGCLLIACHKLISKKNEINKIEIATGGGGCLKGCPVIGIIIDSTLSLKYYGGYKAKLKGYYSGKVTEGFWDALNMKLKHINFKNLDTTEYLPMDEETAEVIFYWDKHKRRITRPVDEDPDVISQVLTWIANSYKHIELYKLKDSVKFETTYQFKQPLKRIIDQVKFPPPKKNRYGKKSDE